MYLACCKGKGHTVDQCFKIIGYPEWYNAIKASKGSSSGGKLVANVHVEEQYADNPLDDSAWDHSGGINSEMLYAICQEVIRAMKGKQT